MRLTIFTIFIVLVSLISVRAQTTYTVKGSTIDTVLKTRLTTTVTIVNAKDSILRKFTHSASDGSFNMTGLPAGNYLLLVTYPDYADYIDGFTIDPTKKEYDFGNISMSPKSRILQEVIIKGKASLLKLKGDTTEINAKALVIQPNSKVEDLLKQVAGMEVDKDGKIKYQGEAINKVLVDGEEFFGDDPTLVTKNIRGDMVDKFQIYDKKSDQATFTGIDDGIKTKTLNVKLKEDKKKGVFGKVIAAGGTRGFYEGQAMYNLFRAKEKFSVYGITANDGKMGLGFAESSKLGTTSNVQVMEGGGIAIFGGGDDMDYYNGRGLPTARTGGAHYDGKWNDDKESINANYKIGSVNLYTEQNTTAQTIFENAIKNTVSGDNTNNHSFRQKLDATYQNTLSATANLKVDVSGNIRNTDRQSNSSSVVTDANGALLNRRTDDNTSNGQAKTFTTGVFYSKKLKKAGRTFSWDVNQTYTENNGRGYQRTNLFTAVTATDSLTDQYKPSTAKSFVLNNSITYTEPLSKTLALTVNYGLQLNNSSNDQLSYNASAPGIYNIFDDEFSSSYTLNQLANQVGASFNYHTAKTLFIFGTNAAMVGYKQINQFNGNVFHRNFTNWRPSVRYQYKITTSKTLTLNYNGSNTQPNINQIQPVRSNADVTNITEGNPNLGPAFNNNFNFNYNAVQPLKNQNFSVNGGFSFVTNAIVNRVVYDAATGRSVSKFENLNDRAQYNYNLSMFFGKPVAGINTFTSIYTNGSVYNQYQGSILRKSVNQTYSASFTVSKYKANKYSLSITAGPNYTFSTTEGTDVNNNSAGANGYSYAALYLPGSWQITSNLNYNYRAKTDALPSQSVTNWNASIGRGFLKEKNLRVDINANNLLDQVAISRVQNANLISQTSYNTIRRYFLLTVSWDFTKFGTTTDDKK